ncbi:MAG: DUF354 domain-containing protein [Myxococcota bacterium]|nr:DUF354 domain-containing protein [Myxococcota bacterium]
MRLLFDVLHPAHVHFFRPLAEHARGSGGEVLFTARKKDVTVSLLEAYGLPYEVLTEIGGGPVGLAREMAQRTWRLARRVRSFKPELLLGIMGPVIAPVGRLCGVPSWVFYDTETATATNRFVYPLCNRLFVPEAYRASLPAKAERYPGYHELAYLHPRHFEVDATVREEAGLEPDEDFAVVRLVSWEASHDIGDSGFSDPVGFVQRLATRIRVLITAERGVPPELRDLTVRVRPERIHHLLGEAALYVGEGATMAAEAAILGTPAVFVHTARLGYMLELEESYRLLHNEPQQERVEEIVGGWLDDLPASRSVWKERRAAMLEERIDVADWLIERTRSALS